MARKRSYLLYGLIAAVSYAFAALTATLPLPIARALGRALGRAAYYLVPRIRQVGLANLDLAYGDALPRSEKLRILKASAENVGIVAAEFSRIPRLKDEFLTQHVTVRGAELLDLSRGGLLIGAHLGNWEWMGAAFHGCGYRVAEIVRPLDNPWLNRLIEQTRQAGLAKIIAKTGAGAELIRLLREGWLVGVLVDQNPRTNGAPVRFFGQSTWATVAPAMAALRARVPIYGASFLRDAQGHYTLHFLTKLEMDHTGDTHRDLLVNTQRCQDFVEELIRRSPEQWLWFHRRWKPRPRLEAEWIKRQERRDRDAAT